MSNKTKVDIDIDVNDELKECIVDNYKLTLSSDWFIHSTLVNSNITIDQLSVASHPTILSYRHGLFRVCPDHRSSFACKSFIYKLQNGLIKQTDLKDKYHGYYMPWLGIYFIYGLDYLKFYDCLSQKLVAQHHVKSYNNVTILSKNTIGIHNGCSIYMFKCAWINSKLTIKESQLKMFARIGNIIVLTNSLFMVIYEVNSALENIDEANRYVINNANQFIFEIIGVNDGLIKRRGLFLCSSIFGRFDTPVTTICCDFYHYQFNEDNLSFIKIDEKDIVSRKEYYFPMSEHVLKRVAKEVYHSTKLIKDLVNLICQYLTWST